MLLSRAIISGAPIFFFFFSLWSSLLFGCVYTAGQTVAPWVSILKHAISTSSLSSSLNLNVTIFTWSFIGILNDFLKKKDPDNRLKLDFSIYLKCLWYKTSFYYYYFVCGTQNERRMSAKLRLLSLSPKKNRERNTLSWVSSRPINNNVKLLFTVVY